MGVDRQATDAHDDRDRAGAQGTKKRRVSGGIDAKKVLWWCLGVSVLVHAGLAASVFDRPIGYIDPSMLHSKRRVINLQQASYAVLHAPMPGQGQPREAEPTAQAISERLLKAPAQRVKSVADQPLAEQKLEKRPADLTGKSDAAAKGNLPEQLFASMGQANASTLAGSVIGGGTNNRSNGLGAGQGQAKNGAAQAKALLAHGNLGVGLAGGAALVGGPRVARPLSGHKAPQPTTPDRRLMAINTKASGIDFASLALGGTTKLKIPAHLDTDFDYYLTRYRTKGSPGYFRVDIAAKRSLSKLPTMYKNVVFILDTSASIPPGWVRQATEGIVQSLPSLNAGDKFNIILFNENSTLFDPHGMAAATAANLRAAKNFLYGVKPGGYTDVNAALRRLLVPHVPADRVYDLILISDGKPTQGVVDTRQLINLITQENALRASIYCVGIGEQQNHQLLDFLAYRNQGFTEFVNNNEHTAQVIRRLMSRLRYPLIKNVRLAVAGVNPSQVFPRDLPDIHQGERFSVFGRYGKPKTFTMRITGTNNGHQVDFTFTRNLLLVPMGNAQLAHDWAFWKLHHLYSEIIRHGGTAKKAGVEGQLKELRNKYHLKTLY